ncbi:hypothetical protein I316_00553 [Kwoniella heveanensis BCC8398]|uniref:Pre-rRNA-processing protein RIX1 n=1 Tax=Kwoniella heveanensis BCC8398 TaxID=1296120 RepID=A0A1B9H2D8_9TREE|nr:hypothetical protein I316_00553 [Kwoniella heveanensis BCC8398]
MSTAVLSLLGPLPFSHPSNLPLLQSHKPFTVPSSLSQSSLNKYTSRLNSLILSREDGPEKRSALEIADAVVAQDEEGWVMSNYGKGWVGTCLSYVATPSSPLNHVSPYLSLLATLVLSASQYPSFEREVVHPIMGKLSVSLGKLFQRNLAENQPDWDVVLELLSTIKKLLLHSPANFRPLVPNLKPAALTLILQLPSSSSPYPPSVPAEVRRSASDLLASLHVTSGKASAPQAWGAEMRDALGGFGKAVAGLTADAWEAEPVKVTPPSHPSALPELPVDPLGRLAVALDWIEGYVEVMQGLLRFPTNRPVPVPIAQITVPYISPQHHAALLASLPRLWTAGLQLLGGVALACGDHIFPHLGSILDHTVWLAERLPSSMIESQAQLLKFHHLILNLYPPALLAAEYPSRLIRLSLKQLSPLLENRSRSTDVNAANGGGAGVGGKRGKKRARGAEDGLVGGLEGRDGRSLAENEVAVIIQALQLSSLLHPTPLLSPSLLTYSIRLHLSLYLSLPSLSSSIESPVSFSEVQANVHDVLKDAVLITEGENGTGRGWKSLIISVLQHKDESLAPILHPSLPPLQRPLPPLSQLHFFVKEGEEERKERLGMGFGSLDDLDNEPVPVHPQEEEQKNKKGAAPAHGASTAAPVTVQESIQSTTAAAVPQVIPAGSSSHSAPSFAISASTGSKPTSTVTAPAVSVASTTSIKEQSPAGSVLPQAVADAPAQVPSISSDFISMPIATPTPTTTTAKEVNSTSTTLTHTVTSDVVMLGVDGDDDDEAIPDLDSGSDDFDEEDEDDDDDEEEEEVE